MATHTRRSSVISLFTRAPIVSVVSNHTSKYSVFKGTIISPSPTCGATVEARIPPPPPRTRRQSLPHPHPPASAPRRTPAPRRTRGASLDARDPKAPSMRKVTRGRATTETMRIARRHTCVCACVRDLVNATQRWRARVRRTTTSTTTSTTSTT